MLEYTLILFINHQKFLFTPVFKNSKEFKRIHNYSKEFKGTQDNSVEFKRIQRYSSEFNGIQECLRDLDQVQNNF